MQLKKIKLAGFKSFVDPTTIPLPSNLIAVVGPNGCGKSNIIDAVCWVMGESSAKYLRGESLTDVIFNGSTARKPVGQASVELVFDNQDGSLGGEYASYAEISIRRQITRDSESGYFLNGVRCRRRDIIDIFLGTGLGPRSYSIIGQNMISRVVEAKPDDMRHYLEEAAGVSKYKERRRETENRIQHTKENLARLDDIRAELEKQLNTLQRQANAAEKFKTLKQEERTLRAEWLGTQWRQLDTRLVECTLQVKQQETGLESHQAALSEIDLSTDQKREAQRVAGEVFQEVQKRYYTVGNDITRFEQDIHHHQERERQRLADIEQAEKDWTEIKTNLEEIEDELRDLAQEITALEPELATATTHTATVTGELRHAEEGMQNWQNRWDAFHQLNSKTTQTAQVEQTRIQHLEQRLAAVTQRQADLEQEINQIDFSKLDDEIATISQQIANADTQVQDRNEQLTAARATITTLHTQEQQTTQRLDEVRNQLQKAHGRQASLEALQQTALGQRNDTVIQWLAKHQLDKQPRLAQGMEVEKGWEYAVEKILGAHLQAVCVDDLAEIVDVVADFANGSLSVFSKNQSEHYQASKPNALIDKVKSAWPLESLLAGIYVAETREEALAMCKTLAPKESVITRDGLWFSSSWLRITRADNPEAGVFQREQELRELAKQITELTQTHDQLATELTQCREELQQLEKQSDSLQKAANDAHTQSAEVHAQYRAKQERLAEIKARVERFRKEQADGMVQLDKTQADLVQARAAWQQAMIELEQQAQQRTDLIEEREELREKLQAVRDELSTAKENAHQLEIRVHTSKSQQGALQQNRSRLLTQSESLAERKAHLENDLQAAQPIEELEQKLAVALTQRLAIEEELNQARTTTDNLNNELRSLEMRRQETNREIVKYRDILETLRVECQGLKVKSEGVLEQLQETGLELSDILKQLPEEATADEWHSRLESVTQRITRLGAINLVAIEEFTTCSERKLYLDQQHADLTQGLATLEDAIAKIDRETRALFKETFDKVNDRFQELFPKVFGGGRAYLELTGENLLDAGITVMACPPGKRNSTIHLLSGGEKAMTAIALVFSIFHLNPAPFCLLDEVDAPLDDANIGRFCQLVKDMSDKTQFIFISHNKIAIEMGNHLMGVTMHEPGVSRLVSVDVREAISLAEA